MESFVGPVVAGGCVLVLFAVASYLEMNRMDVCIVAWAAVYFSWMWFSYFYIAFGCGVIHAANHKSSSSASRQPGIASSLLIILEIVLYFFLLMILCSAFCAPAVFLLQQCDVPSLQSFLIFPPNTIWLRVTAPATV